LSAVAPHAAAVHREERVHEARADRADRERAGRAGPGTKKLCSRTAARRRRADHLVLGEGAEPEVLEHRHELRQHEGRAGEVEAQLRPPLACARRRARRARRPVPGDRVEQLDVGDGALDRHLGAIRGRERRRPARGEARALPAVARHERVGHRLLPGAHDGGDRGAQLVDGRRRGARANAQVEQRAVALDEHHLLVEQTARDARRDLVADRGARLVGEALARYHDEHGRALRLGPAVQRHDHVVGARRGEDRLDLPAQLLRAAAEQRRLRQGVEHRHDRLVVVAPGTTCSAVRIWRSHAAEERDLRRLLRVRLPGEEAEEAARADDAPVRVEPLHDDVVHRRTTVDGRFRERLRDGEEAAAEEPRADPFRQLVEAASGAESPSALPGGRIPRPLPARSWTTPSVSPYSRTPRNTKRTVHEPAEEVRDRGRLRRDRARSAARDRLQLAGHGLRARDHRREVVGHEPHVRERGADHLLEPGEERSFRRARDGDVRERLARCAALGPGDEHEPVRRDRDARRRSDGSSVSRATCSASSRQRIVSTMNARSGMTVSMMLTGASHPSLA
jgi:hypothetical protein